MENLKINGTVDFMGIEIPNILGGFGEDKKCILVKTVAQIHDREVKELNKLIKNNSKRFEDGVHIIDVKQVNDFKVILNHLNFSTKDISNSNYIYLLSERGYANLIKIMEDDTAWEVHDKLIDEYFTMREQTQQQLLKMPTHQEALRGWADALDEKSKLQQQIEEQAPKVETYNIIADASKVYSMQEVANITNEILGMGRNKLYAFLREQGILQRNNLPYSKYSKYFEVKISTHNGLSFSTTYVKFEGIEYIIKLYQKVS